VDGIVRDCVISRQISVKFSVVDPLQPAVTSVSPLQIPASNTLAPITVAIKNVNLFIPLTCSGSFMFSDGFQVSIFPLRIVSNTSTFAGDAVMTLFWSGARSQEDTIDIVNMKCGTDNLFVALPSPIKLKDDSVSYIISAAPVIGSAVGGMQVQAVISGFPRASAKDSISIVSGSAISILENSARFECQSDANFGFFHCSSNAWVY